MSTKKKCIFALQGRVIFCSGSPFPPVTYKGKTYTPGQGNNAYIFPGTLKQSVWITLFVIGKILIFIHSNFVSLGVALGVIATLMHHIPDDVFLIAARELAASVRDEDLESGSLYPPLDSIREVSLKIAIGITKYAYCKGMHLVSITCCLFASVRFDVSNTVAPIFRDWNFYCTNECQRVI